MSDDAQQSMIEGLMARLTGGGTFAASMAGRIYDSEAPAGNATYPIAVVTVVSDPAGLHFTGTNEIDAMIQIDIIGLKSGGAAALRTIAGQLYDRLHGAALTISGYNHAVAQQQERGEVMIEADELRISPQYNIKAS